MADQGPADQLLPAFWSLSPSSGSEPDYRHHQDPSFLTLPLFDRSDASIDSADFCGQTLGLGFHCSNGGWGGDEFFIGPSGSESESASEFSRARPLDPDRLPISGFESHDSISNDQIQDMNSPTLILDVNGEFEWEEIDNQFEQEQGDEVAGNVEWEVLLTNLGNGEDAESYFDDGFVYTNSDYDELAFAQFQQLHDSALKGSPPAAKSAVESLQSFVLSKEDICRIGCAVCKDEILVGEKAKSLPCSHCYHDECILPWLEMRNTCPLCRYELLTDDPVYESWKARRMANVNVDGLEIVEAENIRYV